MAEPFELAAAVAVVTAAVIGPANFSTRRLRSSIASIVLANKNECIEY